ncbi:MAG: phosphoribosylamine--glycine ligase [Thermoflexales bacterium]
MNILIVGNGGREHALAWKLAQSPRVQRIYVAPGNAGTCGHNVAIAPDDIPALLSFARESQIDLTVVGPEALLAAGIVDDFQAAGLRVFGPRRAAAQLEASKLFSKSIMRASGVPTADFAVFDAFDQALRFSRALPFASAPACVIKADGLAAGKGVFVCDDADAAEAALRRIMLAREFGAAGAHVIIEERLNGREVSLLAFCDGAQAVLMPPARDHKRIGDGDTGPNTGGMGAYAPAPDVSPALLRDARRLVFEPILEAMRALGTPYVGVLYAGLMLLSSGAGRPDRLSVLEFNCRFGDPETQVILPLLETDLLDVLSACIDGRLSHLQVAWRPGATATIVLASGGYPGPYVKGLPIHGLADLPAGVTVFHAGTDMQGDRVVTRGGRVLDVTSTGADLSEALARAYAVVSGIHFDGMQYRTDIGGRAAPGTAS